jgi:2,4-dienoyl-CoA reductase-like NADH-dependent reductase (Old Yellow Enzyme family)
MHSNDPLLFSTVDFGPLALANRIVIAPMCQYSAEEGKATDWHRIHLGSLALSGAGLLMIEATAVEPRGRITYADLGLWDDATEAALAAVLTSIRRYSAMPIGIQLAHAGRKASTAKPWEGGGPIAPTTPNGWQTVAASALPFHEAAAAPQAASESDIASIAAAFAAAARRAQRLGLDAIEIHAAHGYLLHQFLSPLSNQRDDAYGGSLANRMRLALQVLDTVRAAVSPRMAVGMRISATDWVGHGWDLPQSIELALALEQRGCDFLHVSSGGNSPQQKIPVAPGYQAPLAEGIKRAVRAMPVIAVGLITEPHQAERILVQGQADAVALARGMLYDPRWPWHAAAELGARVSAPPQYLRCEPHAVKGLFTQSG